MSRLGANREADRVAGLETANRQYLDYIRQKTNQLLEVMGTDCLRPEELDDRALIDLDPIGIIAKSFGQVLDFLKENIVQLQQARDELQAIFDATGVGISIIDRDFGVERCNEKQRELLVNAGLPEVPGSRCYEIYCSKSSPGLDCPAVETFATGRPVVVREMKKRDKFFQVVTTPYARDEQGQVTKVIEVLLDVTEKKKAEVAEREQRKHYLTEKAKLATVIESLTEGLLVLDQDDLILAFNRAAGEITGRRGGEMLGKPLSFLFPAITPRLQEHPLDFQGVELPFSTREAEELTFSANSGCLLDSEGRRIGRVVTFRDVTAEKKRLELFHRAEKLAAVGQLSAGVAHELNTPLCSILGYALLLLKEDGFSAVQRERLGIIVEQAKKSSGIIKALLSFARHSNRRRLPTGECDLNQVIDHALRILSAELLKRGIDLVTDLKPLPRVRADRGELEQVVLNLVLNALQALRQQGRITVRTRQTDSRVVMTVTDNGPGVPREIRSRIFDPFFTTKPVGEGTGLGLSICSGIVSDMGGTMEVRSARGGGAVFVVSLPVRRVADLQPGAMPAGAKKESRKC